MTAERIATRDELAELLMASWRSGGHDDVFDMRGLYNGLRIDLLDEMEGLPLDEAEQTLAAALGSSIGFNRALPLAIRRLRLLAVMEKKLAETLAKLKEMQRTHPVFELSTESYDRVQIARNTSHAHGQYCEKHNCSSLDENAESIAADEAEDALFRRLAALEKAAGLMAK